MDLATGRGAGHYLPAEDKRIFSKAVKLKDAAILYSRFDKSLTNLAEQLYKLAPVFSVDFELTKNIHRLEDMAYLYEQQAASASSDASSASASPASASSDASAGGASKNKNDV